MPSSFALFKSMTSSQKKAAILATIVQIVEAETLHAEIETRLLAYEAHTDNASVKQYERFVNAMYLCTTHPSNGVTHIGHYTDTRNDYFPVGTPEARNPLTYRLFSGVALAGTGLVLASIPVFLLNPLYGAITLGAGLLLLLSSAIYFCRPKSPDITSTRDMEEALLLELLATIQPKNTVILPDVTPVQSSVA